MLHALILIELALRALLLGALYSIISVGFSLIFGVARILNFAHGIQLVFAAFLGYLFYNMIGDSITAALSTILISFFLGAAIEKIIYPFRHPEIRTIMLTFGLGRILEQILYTVWGPIYIMYPLYISGSLKIFDISISTHRITLAAFAISITLLLWLFVTKTKLGKAIRAVAQDEEAAMIMGINIKRIRLITFALAGALAGIAGLLLNTIYMFHPAIGWEYLGIALSIVIFAGLGDVRGAIIAGFILSLTETLIGYFISPLWRTVAHFVIIIIILLVRPSGLFRRRSY